MSQPDPLAERYRSDGVVIIEGDCRHGMQQFIDDPPAVVVTDPPYAYWRRIGAAYEANRVVEADDEKWSHDVWLWMREWLPAFRTIMHHSQGLAWFFTDQHYAGFYLRWARWTAWPVRAVTMVAEREMLLAFSDRVCPRVPRAAAMCARKNRQGPNKPPACLRPLIAAAPPGRLVDPFCGSGSTLEAAVMERRHATGYELEDNIVALAVDRVQRAEARVPDDHLPSAQARA